MKERSRKRPYRSVAVSRLDWERLAAQVEGRRLVVGIDVAKVTMLATFMNRQRRVVRTVRWDHLPESRSVVARLAKLPVPALEVAMEPSGVYGDSLRTLFWNAGVAVYRVAPKRSHDFAEVYDGVPSSHDAKAAAIVAYLHWSGLSERWPLRSSEERALAAAVRTMTLYDKLFEQGRNRMEGRLTLHWPELPVLLDLDSATLLELVAAFGSPLEVAKHTEQSAELMRQVGGRFLQADKIEAVMRSASVSVGVPMVAEERDALRALAVESRRAQRLAQKARRRVESLARSDQAIQRMGQAVGLATAAVLVATVGDPRRYPNAGSWVKSLGLNLKERSSGRRQGQVAITKRGPGLARKYLFMAMLRWLKDEPLARAWYQRKTQRDGGLSKKALVALMRKSSRALWWVAQGAVFAPEKLFDVERLEVAG